MNTKDNAAAINEANRMTASAGRVLTLARHAFVKARDNLTQLEEAYEKAWHEAHEVALKQQEEA